ncbi:unnamed protein product [Phaeothamnion confervicola]
MSNKRTFAHGVAVGLNYTGSLRLQNCISDAECMATLMTDSLHIPQDSIQTITDSSSAPLPTKDVIFGSLKSLLQTSKDGAVLFSMSSHGFSIPDRITGCDELDRNDEAVLCADMQPLKDDEIYKYIAYQGATSCILMIVDACHSGTVVDLPYSFNGTSWTHATRRGTPPRAFVVGVSGAMDTETASDGAANNGAFTAAFLRAIRTHGATISYATLYAELLAELKLSGQHPVITCSRILPAGALFLSEGCLVMY